MAGMLDSNNEDKKAAIADLSNLASMYAQSDLDSGGIMGVPKGDTVDAGSWWSWLTGTTRQKSDEYRVRAQEDLQGMDFSGAPAGYQSSMEEDLAKLLRMRGEAGPKVQTSVTQPMLSDELAARENLPVSELNDDEYFLRTGELRETLSPAPVEDDRPSTGLMSPDQSAIDRAVEEAMNQEEPTENQGEPIPSVSNVEPLSDPDIIEKIEAAPDTTAALEVVGESSSLPEGLINNPLSYILNKGFIGLSESNVDDHKSIVGFFKNSLGDKQTFATAGTQGATSIANDTRAWCGVFVDHVLTNLGLPRLETGDSWDRMRAKQYLNLGTKVDTDSATAGDLVIKKGKKTYHVGFYVGTQELVDLGGKKGIKEFQEALMSKGYDLPKFGADGDFGSETIAALKQYQKSLGMKETGVMDAETYKGLTGKDATTVKHVLMLGGNQNNEVNVTAYPASQIQGIRRVGEVAAIPKDTFSEITRDMQKGGGVL